MNAAHRRRRLHALLPAVLSITLLLPLAPDAHAAVAHVAVYSGGGHPVTFSSPNWHIHDPLYSTVPGFNAEVIEFDLQGVVAGPSTNCGSVWHGLSTAAGTLVAKTGTQGGTQSYTVFDVVIERGGTLSMTMTGRWLDSQGRNGVFATTGWWNWIPNVDCSVWFDYWAFAQGNPNPQDLVDLIEDQLPVNQAPEAPTLHAPSDGQVFLPQQLQIFTVQAVDPDDDPYVGRIYVRQPTNSEFDEAWQTALAPSGSASSGLRPEGPYPVHQEQYEWYATAFDLRLEGPRSQETRTFRVGSSVLSLVQDEVERDHLAAGSPADTAGATGACRARLPLTCAR